MPFPYPKIASAEVVVLSNSVPNVFDGFRNGEASVKDVQVTLSRSNKIHLFKNVPAGGIIFAPTSLIWVNGTTSSARIEGLIFE